MAGKGIDTGNTGPTMTGRGASETAGAEKILVAALDEIDQGILIYDRSLIVRAMNGLVCPLFDLPAERFTVGTNFEDWIRYRAVQQDGYQSLGGSVEERIAKRLAAARSFQPFLGDLNHRSGRCIEARGKPIPAGYMLIYRDVSERKRVERDLEEQRTILQTMLDNAPFSISLRDRSGRLKFVNKWLAELYDLKPEDLFDKTFDGVFGHLEHNEISNIAREVVETGQPILGRMVRPPRRPDRCMELYCLPVMLDDQRHALTLSLDKTEQTSAERELIRSRDEALRANDAKNLFLAHMSHELRTPLNVIMGFSEVMALQAFGPMTPPRYREYADDIHSTATHLLQLINDILDISRIEAQRVELRESAFNLQSIAETVTHGLQHLVESKQQCIRLAFPEDFPDLWADKRLCSQVVTNLLTNAIKYTPVSGEIRVTGSIGTDSALALSVADNGIGMRAEDIPRALEEFGQVRSNTMVSHDGAGLGLPLVKRLVELHGGGISIVSTLGQGTTVTVTFPAARRA